jgi:hypothetical protein
MAFDFQLQIRLHHLPVFLLLHPSKTPHPHCKHRFLSSPSSLGLSKSQHPHCKKLPSKRLCSHIFILSQKRQALLLLVEEIEEDNVWFFLLFYFFNTKSKFSDVTICHVTKFSDVPIFNTPLNFQ